LKIRGERPLDRVGRAFGVHGNRVFRREILVECPLVERAGLAIDRDNECLIAERLHVFLEMGRNETSNFVDPVFRLEKGLEPHRAVEDAS
jgi:hypothetical protein